MQLLVLVGLLGFLYSGTLAQLTVQWWNDPNYSHGFFLPAFSAFVLWKERQRFASLPVKPSLLGLGIVAGALLMFTFGVLGAEVFLARASLLFLLAGLLIYFRGWRWLRAVLFPWGVLFLMIPIPVILFNQVALPLQFLASRLASGFLAVLGVPVLREGNVIQLPTMALEVVEACSGIRSLISLVTLAVIYGYFFEPRTARRVVLMVAAVPIAVVANGLRIMGTGLLGEYWNPTRAEGFFHSFSGWVIFVLSLILLFVFHSALSRIGNGRKAVDA